MRFVMIALVCASAVAQEPAEKPAKPSLHLGTVAPKPGKLRHELSRTIGRDGSVATRLVITFAKTDYDAEKRALGDPRTVLRRVLPADGALFEATGATAAFDDRAKTFTAAKTEFGATRNEGGGRWSFAVPAGATFINQEDGPQRTEFLFTDAGELNGRPFVNRIKVVCPEGADGAAWDPAERVVRWTLTPATGGAPKLRVGLEAAERVMSGAYKAYGLGGPNGAHWIAKVAFKNEGDGAATDLRVRHRVEGYSEWSPWSRFPEVAPGQMVVERCHPVLSAATAALKSDTPANLFVEWKYTDAAGKSHEDSDGKKLVLLGGNEFIFNRSSDLGASATFEEAFDNASMLAAWVTRDDPVIRQFAALAAKRAGGAAAGADVFSALATLKGCYELLIANDFTYQHPPSLSDPTLSFDNTHVQNVKYPRDVVRDRSGTCIDLAVLYAAMLHADGLRPYLIVIPGHCFAAARMPDGALVGVEATGVGGGGRLGNAAATFGQVLRYGTVELQKALEGPHVLVDVVEGWTHGVSCPELPDLGPDILGKWGVREKADPTKRPHIAEMREEQLKTFQGTFDVALKDESGGMGNASLRVVASVDATTFLVEMKSSGFLPTDDGKPLAVDVTQVFEGTALMNLMKCVGLRKIAKVRFTETTLVLPPDEASLMKWDDGFTGELLMPNPAGKPSRIEILAPKN